MLKFLRHLFFPHDSNNQRAKFLHPSSLVVTIGLFIVFQVTINQLTINYPQILGYASQISPEEIIRLTNIQRTSSGLSEVELNSQLSAAAAQKAADMIARDYWAHVSPVGTQPWNFITQAGYSYRYAGENLARDFSDAKSVVDAWVASPSHRENLLNSRYQDIGIAVIDGQLEGRETTLVVQFFGAKLSAAPSVSSVSTSIVKPVSAATSPSTMNYEPRTISPFDVTKAVSLTLLIIFVTVLVIDLVAVYQKKITRWTSKSFAHLLFMLALLIAAFIISKGQIL
ncbi:MAG: hypothetical protein UX99_C0009G0003 [Candidatus Amesbacteria bacterium GW2011_GWB1_47_26]|uniref:SCP domain-containing protein n=1 Tax=Candidatus Amesbacteria bacterium GW2011_GWC2_45_19 TaxID=1618366 RepID=A0A0G1PDF8_9BACT|nr:MAG: hypothetical protein UX05_C0001G0092 [Candidatus Amesbacteria bacterium GW2011_GWC2_45_19]KKU38150.1 MAG: hypothetical protein UX52_C0010G0002 [Candidatus Amesbacteria bacterium GW2011_GWA1_46_35]KKU69554.1 MAG: hypothetical protein UX93_C0001G0139 [Microgenomates group bacterium GW2011_GWC1_47_20]KKU74637.1 MAG: hypothetical protein UX99_C0009G0003 [Candidatus Amesbacteria bacterium GW2011_GWB1_47_26]